MQNTQAFNQILFKNSFKFCGTKLSANYVTKILSFFFLLNCVTRGCMHFLLNDVTKCIILCTKLIQNALNYFY